MMANNHINELIATDELFQLIQKENVCRVGILTWIMIMH